MHIKKIKQLKSKKYKEKSYKPNIIKLEENPKERILNEYLEKNKK